MKGQARVFSCHAPADEALLDQFNRHLSLMQREGILSAWDQRRIDPGDNIHDEVVARLRDADLVLLLVSADLMASEACEAVVQAALALHEARRLRVVPVLVRPTDWETSPFGGCAPLPSNRKPVTRWEDRDEAWLEVVTGLRRLLRQHARSPNEPWAPTNPYRGLEAFEPEDDDVFFGREALTSKLWQSYQKLFLASGGLRLLAILGPSGSGKSSVARAGLVPALRKRPVSGTRPSQVVLFTPGERPVERLARALLPLLPGPSVTLPAALQLEAETVLRHRGPREEADGLRRLARTLPDIERAPLMVLVDQFEEVYAQCKDPAERDLFVALLLHAATDSEGHVSVVLTLRSDFLGETHHHPDLNQAITCEPVVVGVMSETEIRAAIVQPAAQAGHPMPESTVSRLLEQTKGREGALPLLEFALQRIWEGILEGKKPGATLRAIGGVGGALASRAQELFDSLSLGEQVVARRMFLGLVQLGEGARDTRRRVPLKELVSHGESEVLVQAVARRFSKPGSRLVTLALGDDREQMVEVTHEALFNHWKLLQGWIGTGREDLRLHRRLEEAAADWERRGYPAGLLWRPPDLDLLREFQKRAGRDMTERQVRFWRGSEHARKYERLRAIATLTLGVLAVVAAPSIWALKERERGRETQKFAHDTEQALLATYVEEGRRELLGGHSLRAALWLARAYEKADGPQAALKSLLADSMIPVDAAVASLQGHQDPVETVAFSPDGGRVFTGCRDSTGKLWDVRNGRLLASIGSQASEGEVAFSPDGTRVLTASLLDDTARIWDVSSGKVLATLEGHRGVILAVAFSPDGTLAFTGSSDRSAKLWDGLSGKLLTTLEGHQDGVLAVAFSPDGTRLVTGSGSRMNKSADPTAKLWDVRSGKLMASLEGHTDDVRTLAFSPDGTHVLTASSSDSTARLWDAQHGKLKALLNGHQAGILAAAFSPDGARLVTGSSDTTVKLWDVKSGSPLATLQGHRAGVLAVAFSPDGALLVTGSSDTTAKLWDAQKSMLLATLEGHQDTVSAVAISADGKHILTGSSDKAAKLWNGSHGKLQASLTGHQAAVGAVAFSPDGMRILTGSSDTTAKLWNGANGQLQVSLEGHHDSVTTVAFSPDGTSVLTGSDDHTAKLWDARSGKILASLEKHQAPVNAVAFSSDGTFVLTGSDDRTAKLWDARSGKLRNSLEAHQDKIAAVAISPDGVRVLTGSWDKTAKLWDVRSGKLLAALEEHQDAVSAVAFSEDGTRVITGSLDRTVRLWDAWSGKLIKVLRGHQDGVETVAFSPDRTRVLTGSWDKTAKLWDAQSGNLLASLEGHRGGVTKVAFSPDGERVVTISGDIEDKDSVAKLWDARSGKLLASLDGHQGGVAAVAFSPDGERILTGGKDRYAILWDVHLEKRPKEAIRTLLRCRVPYHLDGEAIVPTPSDRRGCE